MSLAQLALGVPLFAQSATRTQEPAKTDHQSVEPPSTVTPNRTRPDVNAPPEAPRFSAVPTDAEILRARVFPEPIVPVGDSDGSTNAALAQAISEYVALKDPEQTAPIARFLEAHVSNPWTPSLLLNVGLVFLGHGFFTRAENDFEYAWKLAKNDTSPNGRAVADGAVGEWLAVEAAFGHAAKIDALLSEIGDRPVRGAAAERVSQARIALTTMRRSPEEAFRCGPFALAQLVAALNPKLPPSSKLLFMRTGPNGSSLAQLAKWAGDAGVRAVAVHREGAAPFVVPSVIHLNAGHLAALVRREGQRYLLRDPTLGNIWVSERALGEEASGYAVVPQDASRAGWQIIDDAAAAGVWGRGFTNSQDTTGPQNDDKKTPNNCPSDGDCPCSGMPGYQIALMLVSVTLVDTPLHYAPPVGGSMRFTVTYNQRESHQPQVFTFSNLGQNWTFDWLSYIQDDPSNPNADVGVFLSGGGQDTFTAFDPATGLYAQETRKRTMLQRVSASPIRYERTLPDGSVDVFTQADGAAGFPRRVFMTERRDPQGHTMTFTYDAQLRLVAATDPIGQVTALAYEFAQDPWKITRVTDPFDRAAAFTYDANGMLATSTDTIGLQSSFTYAADGFVTAMTTAYGTTRFTKSESSGTKVAEVTDPLGGKEHVEYWNVIGAGGDPANTVPNVAGQTFINQYLEYRNSLYWDKRAMLLAPGNVSQAHIYHWLHDKGNVSLTSPVLESEKAPLERRVWYAYPSQVSSIFQGDGDQPTVVARVLDDGTTQVWRASYNSTGLLTSQTDPAGRQTAYTYAPNNIDITQVAQAGAQVAAYTYDSRHLPLTVTDAAGQRTTLTYNVAGQLLTATNPKSEITTLAYDGSGYLQSVAAPLSATTAFTYDAYGRVHTATGPDGYVLAYGYDAADRPTAVTFPDGSSTATVYDRLDAARTRDRAGRWTTTTYDALRHPVATRDPLGRVVLTAWCTCGALMSLTDANGHTTTWDRDLQSRATKETRANGSYTTYGYETTTSRLKTITDPKGQVTTYTYALDDRLTQVAYTNAEHATPGVSFTYDSTFPRVTSLTDGTGTTSYGYKAVGDLGALKVASVDGPLTNDTITYDYDELGRVVGRQINSVGLTRTFDALGRLTGETNPLGAFTYGYVGATGRLSSVAYPNGQSSTYSFLGNTNDRRVQTIQHLKPDTSILSKFDYAYDVVGNIATWTQQIEAAAPATYGFTYDVVDQLTGARQSDATQTTLKRFGYVYDAAGNRTSEQIDDSTLTANYDSVNRLTSQTAGGALRFAGTVSEQATVTIQGKPATVDASNHFTGTASLASGTNTVTLTATDGSGNQQVNVYQVDANGAGKTLTDDANGNLTGDGTRTFEWDAENHLVAVNIGTHRSEFTYDGLDRRVRIVEKESGATVRDANFFWDGTEIIEERLTTGEVNRFFTEGEQHNGTARYLTRDHLGSIREVTDAAGTVVTRNDYDPYGRLTRVAGSEDSRFGFTGHDVHGPSGLALTVYRAYDAALGRWLTEDPINLADGPNRFENVLNNPINYIDPQGLDTWLVNRQLNVFPFTGAATSRLNPISHTFVAVTNDDGTVTTYSWGNKKNPTGWNLDRPEDQKAAIEALRNKQADHVGDKDLDPKVFKAFLDLNKPENQHHNYLIIENCKSEANNLLRTARSK